MSFIRHKLKMFLAMVVAVVAVTLSGCGTSPEDYVGTWMGLDERGGVHAKVFQCEVVQSQRSGYYTIRVSQMDYEINTAQNVAMWRSAPGHYFNGRLDKDGNLVTDIGTIKADTKNFRLLYGNIALVRKAKNTELKLKYIIRNNIEQAYPGINIQD